MVAAWIVVDHRTISEQQCDAPDLLDLKRRGALGVFIVLEMAFQWDLAVTELVDQAMSMIVFPAVILDTEV